MEKREWTGFSHMASTPSPTPIFVGAVNDANTYAVLICMAGSVLASDEVGTVLMSFTNEGIEAH